MKELLKKHSGPLGAVLAVALLALWHLFDVREGARATKELWLTGNYLWLCLGALLFLVGFYWILISGKIPLEWGGFFSVLVLGSIYMAVLAPFSAPDENVHFASAYAVSNRLMGQPETDEKGYVMVRLEDEFLLNIYGVSGDETRTAVGVTLNQEAYRILHGAASPLFAEDGRKEMTPSVYKSVRTTPAAYLPQAIGITAARLLGVNGVILAYAGRFFNLLFFAGLMFWIIRLAPFGKAVFLGTALLPMTLHQAASYSYDPFVIGLFCLFGAVCLNLAFVRSEVRKRDTAVLAAIIALLGPCKIVYGAAMGLALLIPVKKFGSRKAWLLSAAAVLGAFGAAVLLINGQVLSGYSTGSSGNFVDWAGEEGYTLGQLAHNPVRAVRIFYETALHQGDEWYFSMIGSSLGTLDPVLSVPFAVVLALTVCLVLLGVRRAGESLYLTFGQKAWTLFLLAVCAAGLMAAMLLAWTPVSSSVILGVQGRYFLPLLPFGILTLKSDRLVRTQGEDGRLLFYMAALNCYAILRLFSIVSLRL